MQERGKSTESKPWWVIALEAAAYIIGLLLAGVGTTACAKMLSIL